MAREGEIQMSIPDRERFCREWEHARQMVLKGLKRKSRVDRRTSSGKRL